MSFLSCSSTNPYTASFYCQSMSFFFRHFSSSAISSSSRSCSSSCSSSFSLFISYFFLQFFVISFVLFFVLPFVLFVLFKVLRWPSLARPPLISAPFSLLILFHFNFSFYFFFSSLSSFPPSSFSIVFLLFSSYLSDFACFSPWRRHGLNCDHTMEVFI